MKILATVNSEVYLAEVTHTELEKLTDKYYGKLPKLGVGLTMDLGAGHDFRAEIKSACRSMVEAQQQFERARNSLLAFAVMVGQLPEPEQAEEGA